MCPNAQRMQGKRAIDETSCAGDVQPPPSKRRRSNPSPRYPPKFWDTLSKIPLTREEQNVPSPRDGFYGRIFAVSKTSQRKAGWISVHCVYSGLPATVQTMSTSTSRSQKRDGGLLSGESGSTSKTKNTSPYDPAFEQMMIDQGVYPDGYEDKDGNTQEPRNLDELRKRLARSRSSLSPSHWSESEFKQFRRENLRAGSESRMMATVVPLIAGSKDRNYNIASDISFNNMKKFHPDVTTPKPDLYYGASASEIDSRVQDDISGYIIPSTNKTHPVAPNYSLAGKVKSGNAYAAQRQAMYDGGVGAQSMHKLQNYGHTKPVYDGNAYSLSLTYHDGTMKMYATHPAPPARRGGNTQYYTTQVDTYGMAGNVDSFRSGAAAYRNAREWTREQRDRFIASANAVAQGRSTEARSFDENEDTDALSDA